MKQVLCTALASTLLLVAAPTQAQQFAFTTGDRVMQGYTPPATNDGYQAGGGGNPGQAPDLSNSPYQSGSIANTGPSLQAAAGQTGGGGGGGSEASLFTGGGNGGGGGAGGNAAILRTVGGDGGPNVARIDLNRTLEGSPTLGGGSDGKPTLNLGPTSGDQKGGARQADPGAGAGGKNTAIMGNLPKGVVTTNPAGNIPCPQCNLARVAGSGTTLVNADAANAAAAGRGNILGTAAAPSTAFVNPSTPYTFKFNAPQTQAFANLGSSVNVNPNPAPVAPVTLQNMTTLSRSVSPGIAAAGVKSVPAGSVTGINSGLGATQLKTLQSVPNMNTLMLRQKP